jgi:hypothetical protein
MEPPFLYSRSSLSENSSTKLPRTKPKIPPMGQAKVHPKPAPSHFEKFAITIIYSGKDTFIGRE